MKRFLPKALILLFAIGCFSRVASADTYGVGDLSFDEPTPGSVSQFDITNLTGPNAFPPFFPLAATGTPGDPASTPLIFTITSLTVDFVSGPDLVLPGSDFTVVDAGDDLDCTGAGCNLFGDSITSATLVGTISPTTGISGLTAPDTGILAGFTTEITPSSGTILVAGIDTAQIYATGTGGVVSTPEPPTVMLLGAGLFGLLLGYKLLSGKEIATTA